MRNGRQQGRLPVKDKRVASKLDARIRELKTLEELEEIVSQAYSFFKAYAQISDGAEMIRFAEATAGWLAGVLQSRGFRASLVGGSSLQHSVVLIAMWARPPANLAAQDINDVMDYIEWLEFRLAGDGDSSRTMYTVYSKMANRAIWDQQNKHVVGRIDQCRCNDVHSKSMVNCFFERNRPIDHHAAIAYLSKVKMSPKDDGGGYRSYGCNAVQLLPDSSPDPWRQNDRKRRFSHTGNWFLVQVPDKDVKTLAKEPKKRLEGIIGFAETNAPFSTGSHRGQQSWTWVSKDIEAHWTKR